MSSAYVKLILRMLVYGSFAVPEIIDKPSDFWIQKPVYFISLMEPIYVLIKPHQPGIFS